MNEYAEIAPYAELFIGLSLIWILYDAKKIDVKKGQIEGFTDYGPWGWFFLSLVLWIVTFPLYLFRRETYKKINGVTKDHGLVILFVSTILVLGGFTLFSFISDYASDGQMASNDKAFNKPAVVDTIADAETSLPECQSKKAVKAIRETIEGGPYSNLVKPKLLDYDQLTEVAFDSDTKSRTCMGDISLNTGNLTVSYVFTIAKSDPSNFLVEIHPLSGSQADSLREEARKHNETPEEKEQDAIAARKKSADDALEAQRQEQLNAKDKAKQELENKAEADLDACRSGVHGIDEDVACENKFQNRQKQIEHGSKAKLATVEVKEGDDLKIGDASKKCSEPFPCQLETIIDPNDWENIQRAILFSFKMNVEDKVNWIGAPGSDHKGFAQQDKKPSAQHNCKIINIVSDMGSGGGKAKITACTSGDDGVELK